jgi:hypothetical protein
VKEPERAGTLPKGKLLLGLLVAIVTFGGLLPPGGCGQSPLETGTTVQTGAIEPITYQVVDLWTLPHGLGQVLVIESIHRNEADLRRMGRELHDTVPGLEAFVQVYDNLEAARLRQVPQLSRKQRAFHDAHLVGAYHRNPRVGQKEWDIWVNGSNDSLELVRY